MYWGGDRGPALEAIVSRMHFLSSQKKKTLRCIGLSVTVSKPSIMAKWIGVRIPQGIMNFASETRPAPLRFQINGFAAEQFFPRMNQMNRSIYEAIVEESPTQPVLIFVSSRRQTWLTALALIRYIIEEHKECAFVRMRREELVTIIESVKDLHLQPILPFGIGIHHAGLIEADRAIMEKCFREAKLQILVSTTTLAWGFNFPVHLVIIKGTEYYNANLKQYVDFPLTDLLQMIGRAGCSSHNQEGITQIFVRESKTLFYKKVLSEPFVVESSLHSALPVFLNAAIVTSPLNSKTRVLDYLTGTYLFHRILENPNYYGVPDAAFASITTFLEALVDHAIEELCQCRCVELSPPLSSSKKEAGQNAQIFHSTMLGEVCAYRNIHPRTGFMIESTCSPTTTFVEWLDLLARATEFRDIPLRCNESHGIRMLARTVPYPVSPADTHSSKGKVFLLLQSHLERCELPGPDSEADKWSILENVLRILHASIDICAKRGWLFSTLRAMHLSQCIIQARWWDESPLLQLPHLGGAFFSELQVRGIDEICVLVNLTKKEKRAIYELLRSPRYNLNEIERNECIISIEHLPLIEIRLSCEIVRQGKETIALLDVNLLRLSSLAPRVCTKHYPFLKKEQFWAIIGCDRTNDLIALERIEPFKREKHIKIQFLWRDDWYEQCIYLRDRTSPNPKFLFGGVEEKSRGTTQQENLPNQKDYNLHFYLVSDSYLGLDLQYRISVPRPEGES